jgi:hypothetical protein
MNVLTRTPTVPITKVEPARHDKLGAGRDSSWELLSGSVFRETELTVREGSEEVIVIAFCHFEDAKVEGACRVPWFVVQTPAEKIGR